jgi:hypothetical protein
MRVTRLNFKEEFPKIVELLRGCEFYSVDLEMTGIDREDSSSLDVSKFPQNCRFLRTAEDVFEDKAAAAKLYAPLQIGFSLFHRDSKSQVPPFINRIQAAVVRNSLFNFFATGNKEAALAELRSIEEAVLARHQTAAAGTGLAALAAETDAFLAIRDARRAIAFVEASDDSGAAANLDGYTAYSFSCHLFPGFEHGAQQLVMSTETIGDFLAKNNMDFNAWVRASLKYVSRERVAALRREKLQARSLTVNEQLLKDVPGPSRKSVIAAFSALEVFAKTAAKTDKKKLLPFLQDDKAYQAVMAKVKLLGLKAVGKGEVAFDELSGAADAAGDGASVDIFDEDKYQATLLFEAMVASKKPLVLHNAYSDLMFLYHAFYDAPLASYAAFKAAVHSMFPVVYDTRTLSSLDVMGSKYGNVRGRLDTTHEMFAKQHLGRTVNINLPIAFGFENGSHDAGYDAFITGSLFLFASKELERLDIPRDRFQGVVPVYGSVFSISLDTATDVLVHTPEAPILWVTPPPGGYASRVFMSKVQQFLNELELPGVTMFTNDSVVFYGGADTLKLGERLESVVKAAVEGFTAGTLIALDVTQVCAAKGIRFIVTSQ